MHSCSLASSAAGNGTTGDLLWSPNPGGDITAVNGLMDGGSQLPCSGILPRPSPQPRGPALSLQHRLRHLSASGDRCTWSALCTVAGWREQGSGVSMRMASGRRCCYQCFGLKNISPGGGRRPFREGSAPSPRGVGRRLDYHSVWSDGRLPQVTKLVTRRAELQGWVRWPGGRSPGLRGGSEAPSRCV